MTNLLIFVCIALAIAVAVLVYLLKQMKDAKTLAAAPIAVPVNSRDFGQAEFQIHRYDLAIEQSTDEVRRQELIQEREYWIGVRELKKG